MIKIIAMLIFLVYNIAVFWYSSTVFRHENKNNFILKIVISISINILFLMYYSYNISINIELYFMMIYLVVLIIEFKWIFNAEWKKAIFGTAVFAINLFAIRLIIIATYSILTNQEIGLVVANTDTLLLLTLSAFSIPIIYIIIFSRFISGTFIDSVLAIEKNLIFAATVMVSTMIYFMLNATDMGLVIGTNTLSWFYLKVGTTGLAGFAIVLVYTIVFSKMSIYLSEYDSVKTKITINEAKLKEMENISTIDQFTKLNTREVAVEKLSQIRRGKGSVILFDIDGLKKANDNYGHNEGDFYILKVAEIVKEIFDESVVARIGGDEILVVGEFKDSYDSLRKTLICYERVKHIKKNYDKPYDTSVSYGILPIERGSTESFETILAQVDARMYEFKKGRGKQR